MLGASPLSPFLVLSNFLSLCMIDIFTLMVISLYVCYVLICYIIGYITFMSRERLSADNADLLGAYHEIIRFESKFIFI